MTEQEKDMQLAEVKSSPNKMQPIKTMKQEFIEYWDGEKYVFKIVEVDKEKYRIGIAFAAAPELIVGVLPRQFSFRIKRQFYRDKKYLGKILKFIAQDRNWKVWRE